MNTPRKPASGGFGTPELLFMLSVGVLVVVVAFPMLLIFFNAFWGWWEWRKEMRRTPGPEGQPQ